MLRDKDQQLQTAKGRLAAIQADHTASDSQVSTLQSSLNDRDKQLER